MTRPRPTRREFLKVGAASLAGAAFLPVAGGCSRTGERRQGPRKIVTRTLGRTGLRSGDAGRGGVHGELLSAVRRLPRPMPAGHGRTDADARIHVRHRPRPAGEGAGDALLVEAGRRPLHEVRRLRRDLRPRPRREEPRHGDGAAPRNADGSSGLRGPAPADPGRTPLRRGHPFDGRVVECGCVDPDPLLRAGETTRHRTAFRAIIESNSMSSPSASASPRPAIPEAPGLLPQ